MPAPAAAAAHQAAMDPTDRVEYVTRFTSLLEEGEKLDDVEIVLYPEASALGFTILETEGFEPAVINDDSIRIWVEVAEGSRQNAQFNSGAKMPVEFTVTTDADPARRFQRTVTIPVVHQ